MTKVDCVAIGLAKLILI